MPFLIPGMHVHLDSCTSILYLTIKNGINREMLTNLTGPGPPGRRSAQCVVRAGWGGLTAQAIYTLQGYPGKWHVHNDTWVAMENSNQGGRRDIVLQPDDPAQP